MKILKDDYDRMVEDAQTTFAKVIEKYWSIAELDVETDNTTYFYEVAQARVYMNAEKLMSELTLDAEDDFEFGDIYYNLLTEELNVRLYSSEEDEQKVTSYLKNLLKQKKGR